MLLSIAAWIDLQMKSLLKSQLQNIPNLMPIVIVALVSLLVRLWGMGYDLPYIYHPDEPHYIVISQTIFKTGDLNPHFFNYPSLFFYINSLAYVPFYLLGKLLGILNTRADIPFPVSLTMGVTHSSMPSTVLLGRSVTALFGVGTIVLAYLSARYLTGKTVTAFLASLMLAVSPTNVGLSRFVTPDTFVTFFAVASLVAALMVYQQGRAWQYAVAGICCGLTISSKYNGVLILAVLLAAHLLRCGKSAPKRWIIYMALCLAGLSFVATTPFAVLDYAKFLNDLKYERYHYSTGHAGMEGNTLQWYLNYMWQTAGPIYLLAALEIVRGLYARSKEIVLLSIFPASYFGFINSFVVRNDRTFLPITPFLFILAASFLTYLMSRIESFRSRWLYLLSILFITCLVIMGLAWSVSVTVKDTSRLIAMDSREIARVWLNDNLPQGATVALESYSPFIDTARFSVKGFMRIIDHEPEWYVANGFEYLVFSQAMYGRFYNEPDRYRAQIEQYESFFNHFPLVKIFSDGGPEIRVYRVIGDLKGTE